MKRALLFVVIISTLFSPTTWAKYENAVIRPIICDDPEIPGLSGVTARAQSDEAN